MAIKTKQLYVVCLEQKRCRKTDANLQAVKLSVTDAERIATLQGHRCFVCGRARTIDELATVEFR